MGSKMFWRPVKMAVGVGLIIALSWCFAAYAGEPDRRTALDAAVDLQWSRYGNAMPLDGVRLGPNSWAFDRAPLAPLGICDDGDDCHDWGVPACEAIGSEVDEDQAVEFGTGPSGFYEFCEVPCLNGLHVVHICPLIPEPEPDPDPEPEDPPADDQTIIDEPEPTSDHPRPLCADADGDCDQ